MIHVCLGLHDRDGRYSKFTGTTIASIFANTSAEFTVHILHDNTLTQDNRDKFIYVAGRYGQVVKFYNVEELCADKIAQMVQLVPYVKNSRVSVGAFFRLLIPQLMPDVDKVIYLDSDLIVNMDIAELWRVDIGDKALGAVAEIDIEGNKYVSRKYLTTSGLVRAEDYFNAGVLLMNLNFLRGEEKNLFNGVKWRGEHTKTNCFDQDILNYLYAKTYVKLPVKFDTFVRQERILSQTKIRRKIYHYPNESLNLNMNDPFNRLWINFFVRTPWFDKETIGQLYEVIQQLHVGLKTSMIQLSALVSGKTRAFVVLPHKVEATRQIFSVHPDEEIILFKSPDSLPALIDVMNRSRGKKVFFVMLPSFPLKVFTDAGFVYGADFVNGFEFLSEANGLPPLDSHVMLKKM